MTSTELKDYLGIVKDLSSLVYEQVCSTTILQTDYNKWKSSTLHSLDAGKPREPAKYYSSLGWTPSIFPSLCCYKWEYVLVCFIYGLGLDIILGLLCGLLGAKEELYLSLMLLSPVIVQLIAGLVQLVSSLNNDRWNKKLKREFEENRPKEEEKYKEALARWESKRAKKEKEYEKTKSLYLEKLDKAKKTFKVTYGLLEDYYSIGVIHPKYQHLSAICSIYEYIETGRCDKLEGPDGAYNLYEKELMMRRIIEDLDVIRENTEIIKNNQFTLYKCMQEINAQLERIGKIGLTLSDNSEMNNYYTKIIAYNTMAKEEATKFAIYSDLSGKSVRLGRPNKYK